MTRLAERELLARLEGVTLAPRRGCVVVFEECVSDATGTHVRPADPVLVPDGASRVAAGLRFTLRSLRRGVRPSPGTLPPVLRAAGHNLRGGRRLGSVVILALRPDASWVA